MTALFLLALLAQPDFSALEKSTGARIGVSIRHLESGRVWAWRGDERFPTMSVYKYPIAIAVLRAVDAARLSLDTRITIRPEDVRSGLSSYLDTRKLAAPKEFTVKELLAAWSRKATTPPATCCLAGSVSGGVTRMRRHSAHRMRVDRSELDMAATSRVGRGRVRSRRPGFILAQCDGVAA